jgi:hypothetical protein
VLVWRSDALRQDLIGVEARERREGGDHHGDARDAGQAAGATEKRGPGGRRRCPTRRRPGCGPLVTTSEKTEDIRPRIASGVTI